MDDDLHQLEAELKRLQPSLPSARLRGGVEKSLAQSQPRETPLWRWIGAVALPAAAAFAVLAWWPDKNVAPPSVAPALAAVETASVARPEGADTLKPMVVENVLYAAHDEGLVTLADGTPARRQRLNYVDTVVWRNIRTNTSLTWSVPREEVRVVPVVFQ